MSESARAQRVAMLWELKTRLDAIQAGVRISFPILLRDGDYRRHVLEKAMTSSDPALESLAVRLSSDGYDEPLLKGGGAWQPAGTTARHAIAGRRRGWLLAAVLAVLALSGALIGYNLHRPVVVSGAITQDTVWSRGSTYRLEGPVYVEGEAVLTIEPGVTVLGSFGSSLVVTRNARIAAAGTAAQPIVFTSARPVGQRAPGDWGGIVLLGNALVNKSQARIEGIPEFDTRGHYGGNDDADSCGVLQYTRIEFAGYEVYADNELNGLTLGGCGDRTVIRNVQVHRALDDGIEVFGGAVDLRHVLITGAGDDGLDWDLGWRGRIQHLVVHQLGSRGSAMEGDSNSGNPDALPRSSPRFFNVTLLGERNSTSGERAIVLRTGSGASFNNVVVQGFFHEAIDLSGPARALVAGHHIGFTAVLFANNGPNGATLSEPERGDADDDAGFDEGAWLVALPGVRTQAADAIPHYTSFLSVDYSPSGARATLEPAVIPKGEFWQEGARYLGAVPPGAARGWLTGWVATPSS